jgi:hypothetical protein
MMKLNSQQKHISNFIKRIIWIVLNLFIPNLCYFALKNWQEISPS